MSKETFLSADDSSDESKRQAKEEDKKKQEDYKPFYIKLVSAIGILTILFIIIFLAKRFGDLNNVSISPTIGAIIALFIIVPYFMWISFLGTTKVNNSEWYKNPFGLPQGSIRAIITLLFVITALLSVQNEKFQQNQWLIGIIGTIIGFYFGERRSENKKDE